jgi:outer membrane protein TolC
MWWLLTTAHAMSLPDALTAAAERSPSADLSAARVAETEARIAEIRSRLLPAATLSAGAVVQNEVTVNFAESFPESPLLDPSLFTPLVIQPGFQLQASGEVSQPLIVPQSWAAGGAARAGLVLARAEEAATVTALQSAVLQAWHASAEAGALVHDAEEAVALAGQLLERGESMVALGAASPDQLLPLRRAVASARAGLAMAQAGSAAADGILAQLTGLTGGADPTDSIPEIPPLEELLAGLQRTDLQVAQARVDAASAATLIEKRGRLPVVSARGGAVLLDPAPDLGEAFNWKVQLVATLPLSACGASQARIDTAEARTRQAQAAQRMALEQAQLEVRAAHGELTRAVAALSASEEALALAREAVAAAEARLESGGGSLMAVQQAAAEQLATRAELTRARAAAARAGDWLVLASGRL